MDPARRAQLAETTRVAAPDVIAAVVRAWPQLVPASAGWSRGTAERAREALRAVVAGLVVVLSRGGLDAHTESEVRRGLAAVPESARVLRSVLMIGVERLAQILAAEAALTRHERRWLTGESGAYLDGLQGPPPPIAAAVLRTVLADLPAGVMGGPR